MQQREVVALKGGLELRGVNVPYVHRFLRERREHILRVWEELVVAEVRRVELTGLALRDTIPEFLDELADWLESGDPPGARKVGAEALKHVLDRLEHGLDLGQVLREYRLLRQAVLVVVLEAEAQEQTPPRERDEHGMAARVVELARLNVGLDIALSDSIEQFVAERDRRAAVEREERDKALRDTNERLREADTRKTEFLAVLSHELRNPLAPIRNSIALLRHAGPLGLQVQRAVEVIDRQTSQLSKLVDELLDIARITSGKVRLHKQVVPLTEVVRSTVEDHRELFDKNRVALRYQDDAPSLLVEVDPARIAQVLANLLQNAVKYTKGGGARHGVAGEERRPGDAPGHRRRRGHRRGDARQAVRGVHPGRHHARPLAGWPRTGTRPGEEPGRTARG